MRKFLNTEKINNILEELYDYWNYDLAMLSPNEAIFYLCDNIDELFLNLNYKIF